MGVAPPAVLSLLFLVTDVSASFTRDLDMNEDDCFGVDTTLFKYKGDTADGRPWYSTSVTVMGVGIQELYLFYDANCDGKTGDAHSKYGHPQWVVNKDRPDPSRLIDLDNNGQCLRDQDKGGSYTRKPSYDMTPPMQEVMVSCRAMMVFGYGDWHPITATGGLVDCPQPYPDHTYNSFTEWNSTNADGSDCGGTDTRAALETCSSPIKECPCKNRRDPQTLKETRAQSACTTTPSTTSSTTTTTTTTTIATTTTSTTSSLLPTSSTLLVAVEDTPVVGDATAGSSVVITSTLSPAASTRPMPSDMLDADSVQVDSAQRTSPRGEDQEQQQQQQISEGMSGTTIALIVMGILALVGIGAALHMQAANGRQEEDAAAAAAAAAAAVYHGNPAFRGEGVDYLEPNPNQPNVYANNKAKMQAYAEASAAVVQNTTAELDSDGYVVDHFNPTDLGRRADLLKDSDGYVVDHFNPTDLGRRASVNVGTRHAIYAIPVAEDERAAVIANTTYGQPNAVVPVGPTLRSNKKKQKQGSVYLGFDQDNEESML